MVQARILLALIAVALCCAGGCSGGHGRDGGDAASGGGTRLTIATVNNADMIVMQGLSREFAKQNPGITLDWVVLEENVLRERTTTDIAARGGQFDIFMLGPYEAPIWGKRGWLVRMDEGLPADYDLDDVLKPVRDGLSHDGKLYALPFVGESSFTYYRKDLFDKAGLKMPDKPTYAEIARFARALHDPAGGVYGIALRGKPGWGENMGLVTTLVNTHGGRWFDENWRPQLDSPEWKRAITFYVDLLKANGPPGSSSNGHNECRALFANGQAAMWIDTTSAAGFLADPSQSRVADKVAYRRGPVGRVSRTARSGCGPGPWRSPSSSKHQDEARRFVRWATSKEYIEMVADARGWRLVPPGHPQVDLREARIPPGRAVRPPGAGGDPGRRPGPPDGQAGALQGHPVRGHPRVPGDRHSGRPADGVGPGREHHRRGGPGGGAVGHRADLAPGGLSQVTLGFTAVTLP